MDEKRALTQCAAWCSRQERCRSEVEERLERMELQPEEIQRIVKRLIEEKYIDNQRYANFFVNDKFKFNGWGRIKIRYSLAQKKIEQEAVLNALDRIDEEEYQQLLMSLLKSKLRGKRGQDIWKQKASLTRFAYSRGFELDNIKSALNKILAPSSDEDF